jgi:hypothetical protein
VWFANSLTGVRITQKDARLPRCWLQRHVPRRVTAAAAARFGMALKPNRRAESFGTEDLLDRGRRDHDAETLQLTDDALIAPPRIFPGYPHDNARTSGVIGGRPGRRV